VADKVYNHFWLLIFDDGYNWSTLFIQRLQKLLTDPVQKLTHDPRDYDPSV